MTRWTGPGKDAMLATNPRDHQDSSLTPTSATDSGFRKRVIPAGLTVIGNYSLSCGRTRRVRTKAVPSGNVGGTVQELYDSWKVGTATQSPEPPTTDDREFR
ncbi:hypothetical protein GCM10009836_35970 [Pseudonocardia ailaonensis]|uniref:Uncharacterized protein n=1 Tax=Pseudonocardia ailaonensis TaxID=367279 RepID=A0ABN2N5U8_9PSEU